MIVTNLLSLGNMLNTALLEYNTDKYRGGGFQITIEQHEHNLKATT